MTEEELIKRRADFIAGLLAGHNIPRLLRELARIGAQMEQHWKSKPKEA